MKKIFRKKALKKLTSPSQLNDYIKVSNPSILTVIVAIFILLIGAVTWGIFGKLETIIKTGSICENNLARCYVKENDYAKIKKNAKISIKNIKYEIESIEKNPIKIDKNNMSYAMHLAKINEGDWVFEVTFKPNLPDGIYDTKILIKNFAPILFSIV